MADFLSGSRTLYIEGTDDEHAIGQLLIRRSFTPENLPEFKASGGTKKGCLRRFVPPFELEPESHSGLFWTPTTTRGALGNR